MVFSIAPLRRVRTWFEPYPAPIGRSVVRRKISASAWRRCSEVSPFLCCVLSIIPHVPI